MKNLILSIGLILSIAANATEKGKDFNNVPQTKKIVAIERGVTDGKTGKASIYVYSKLKTDPSFDVKKDRETVYNENLNLLTNTVQYKNFINSNK
jgi:hypothetical protein